MASLTTKYRPTRYKDVIGQDDAIAILKGLEKEVPEGILIEGETGLGKSSLARIFAGRLLNIKDLSTLEQNPDFVDINIATETGVDHMRGLIEKAAYAPFGNFKIIVLDEIQKLSPAGRSALLKPLEIPNRKVLWLLLTNEPGVLPQTLKDRLTIIQLMSVEVKPLMTLLERTCKYEKIKLPEKVIQQIAENASGTPRAALSILGALLAKLKGKAEGKVAIQKLTKQIIAEMPNPEGISLNLLGTFWSNNPEKFIEILCKLDPSNTNHIVRVMSFINEFMIYKACSVHKKFYCSDWNLLNRLIKIAHGNSQFLVTATKLQLKLTVLINQYPLTPLQIFTVFGK